MDQDKEFDPDKDIIKNKKVYFLRHVLTLFLYIHPQVDR